MMMHLLQKTHGLENAVAHVLGEQLGILVEGGRRELELIVVRHHFDALLD